MPQQPYYAETPFERIVDVHWKKKDEPPPSDRPPPYCGRYGWGSMMTDTGTLITGTPYGPNQFVPMVGTFSTMKADPVYGALTPNGNAMLEPVETMTAAEIGLHAQFIRLNSTALVFTNNQLIFIRDNRGQPGQFSWTVPMVQGYVDQNTPLVIKNYTIRMEWHSDADDQLGLGISHPLTGAGGTLKAPPEPAVILGSATGGTASYTYDFKYEKWAKGEIFVTPGNQYDPDLGGPAFLWWMWRRVNSDGSFTVWSVSQIFMSSVLRDIGSNYTWEIVGGCQPMPVLF